MMSDSHKGCPYAQTNVGTGLVPVRLLVSECSLRVRVGDRYCQKMVLPSLKKRS